jgi:hypothetical protein
MTHYCVIFVIECQAPLEYATTSPKEADMHYKYEVHIVSYGSSDLSHVPSPFFLNRIDASSQGFSGIATVETASIKDVYVAFETASAWCSQQVKSQEFFGAHAKLEQLRGSLRVNQPLPTNELVLPRQTELIHSTTVGAWDVHLDGRFDPELKRGLRESGYILLDYVDSEGTPETTLTLHFLRQETCTREYERVCEAVTKSGGFTGVIYWEDPLGFAVFGEKNNIPRPIVM